MCHDSPLRRDLAAPDLAGLAARLSRADVARWVIAPAPGKMPSYEAVLTVENLADLCCYVLAPDRR
jgi:hypothetical protein